MTDYAVPLQTRREYFSVRFLLYIFSWLCLWQGWSVPGSIFQFDFLYHINIFPGLFLHEMMLLITVFLLIVERVLTGDYTFSRSYFSGPMLMMGFALVFSWTIGMFDRQQFGIIYEAHESILIPISFFIFLNIFRNPQERVVMLIMFMIAAIMKGADSVWVKFFAATEAKGWGTLLFWRDGFLLAMGIIGIFLLAHYRGKTYRWLKILMLSAGPLLIYGLIISFRRTFILAVLVSVAAMFVSLGKGRIKRHAWLSLLFLICMIGVILLSDPIGIIARLVGAIAMPTEEGSAYIRLMEYPNILMNIYHHPIFGVPLGTQWYQYYRMPTFANFTTLGCHNSYLYWPLRTGIVGSSAFLWFLLRTWKAVLINLRTQKTEEDFMMNQFLLHCMIVYNFACFFGLMYADAMNIMTGFILVMVQLQMLHQTGMRSYTNVKFWQTIFRKEIVPHWQKQPATTALA